MPDDPAPGDGLNTRPSPRRSEPDAYGQAALLLAESTLHALLEVGTLTLGQAVEVVRTASEVKVDLAAEIGESSGRMEQSINLLAGIERSLSVGRDGADTSD